MTCSGSVATSEDEGTWRLNNEGYLKGLADCNIAQGIHMLCVHLHFMTSRLGLSSMPGARQVPSAHRREMKQVNLLKYAFCSVWDAAIINSPTPS